MDSSQDIGVLTGNDLPDLGELSPGEAAAQEQGLGGYQPGSPIGKLARENRWMKNHMAFLNNTIRRLRAELAARSA